MGDDAEFNIEHIFPRRYLDDSYLNKTIACRPCNDRKGDRTPAAAFADEVLESIVQRVERFRGSARDVKLARFKTAIPDEDFADRQLNDTRYNSRLAAEYLALLIGGRADAEGNQRVFTPTGQLTGKVRAKWELNDLLGAPNQQKERDDHRHHAIDAIVVGLMTQQQIQRLSEIAGDSEKHHSRHFFKSVPWPWPLFKNDVASAIGAINVSHRPTRTIAGPLHAESIYSKNFGTESQPEHRIRKEIEKLSAREIEGDQIVEPSVRKAVQDKFKALGGGLPSKAFAIRENHPTMKAKDGREIPIHKVRIRVDAKPRSIGKGPCKRNVASGKDSNYASLIYAAVDQDGNETHWEHEVITRREAHERLSANQNSAGEKILTTSGTDVRVFKFALRKNDMLEADGPDSERVLYRVQKISKKEIQLCPHNQLSIQGKARSRWNEIQSIDNLRRYNARRVMITPLGEVKSDV